MSFGISLAHSGRNTTLLEDIDQCISVILFTLPGERIYNPAYGCRLRDFLDKPHFFAQQAAVSVVEAIGKYERRVEVLSVNVGLNSDVLTGATLAQGIIQVKLVWKLSASGLIVTRIYQNNGDIIQVGS